ncbi:MAG: methyltransferase domain-containing protein [Gammaproteobacteria bacterium]|nr:methyltransferase domain-containing protein [Gammaproteobacteria bacterium]
MVVGEVRRARWIRQRRAVIGRYLASHDRPMLHIGSGPMQLDGWLNTDLLPRLERGIIHLDITEPMPFDDGLFGFIYSEHLIEHVTLDAALYHLGECHRVLKPGGVLRISTPDLRFLLDYFAGADLTPVQAAYLERVVRVNYPGLKLRHPSIVLNRFVRDWGHQFIYDGDFLAELMSQAGFTRVIRAGIGSSSHEALRGLERHGTAISEDFNALQTMVLEGTR